MSKESLTPAQKKITTDLLQLTDNRYLPAGMTREALQHQMEQNHQLTHLADSGKTLVFVMIQVNPSVDINALEIMAGNVTDRDPAGHQIAAWVDVSDLISIASSDSVQSIKTIIPPEVERK